MIDCEALICKLTSQGMKEKDPTDYDYMSIIDTKGIIRFVSAKHEHQTGWEPCDVIGKCIFDYVHPTSEMEYKVKRKNGGWFGIQSEKIPIISNEKIVGFIALCRKINLTTCHQFTH